MKITRKNLGLALVLSFTLVMTAFAAPITVSAQTDGSEEPDMGMFPSYYSGQIKGHAVVKEPLANNSLLVTMNGMDIALNITEETLAIDSETGLPASLTELRTGDAVFVYCSAAMTKSLPPQSEAIAIVTRVEKDQSVAELFVVREIISRKDGEVRALNKEGDLIVTFLKDTPLTPYITGQSVTTDDIKAGTRLFIWYEVVALSYPGQTGAIKAVLVDQEEGLGVRSVYTPMAGADAASVSIQDQAIQLNGKSLADQNGLLLLPLRAVAEGLGFTVVWNGEDQSVFLDDGIVKTTLYIGADSYFKASSQAIGLTQAFSLGAVPRLIQGSTYVPAALFNLLYSDNEAVKVELK